MDKKAFSEFVRRWFNRAVGVLAEMLAEAESHGHLAEPAEGHANRAPAPQPAPQPTGPRAPVALPAEAPGAGEEPRAPKPAQQPAPEGPVPPAAQPFRRQRPG